MQLGDLIRESLSMYSKFEGRNLVCPSIPILFFGDSQKYATSRLKAITVGLNPSKEEFPDKGFSRFPEVESVHQEILEGNHLDKYLTALNDYFRRRPYRWFDTSFEPILNGMGASYYDSCENVVLHTDLCSPLATDPTWSRLPTAVKVRFEEAGSELWHALIRRLDPDVVIISVKEDILRRRIRTVNGWKTVYTIPREHPYDLKMGNMMIENKISKIFFGKAAQQPFGTVSKQDKKRIGQIIKRVMLEESTIE